MERNPDRSHAGATNSQPPRDVKLNYIDPAKSIGSMMGIRRAGCGALLFAGQKPCGPVYGRPRQQSGYQTVVSRCLGGTTALFSIHRPPSHQPWHGDAPEPSERPPLARPQYPEGVSTRPTRLQTRNASPRLPTTWRRGTFPPTRRKYCANPSCAMG